MIFVPLAFLTGVTGAFFKALSITMGVALIISFLVAWWLVLGDGPNGSIKSRRGHVAEVDPERAACSDAIDLGALRSTVRPARPGGDRRRGRGRSRPGLLPQCRDRLHSKDR